MASVTVELRSIGHTETAEGSDPEAVIDHAKANCTVGNSVSRGFPVVFVR